MTQTVTDTITPTINLSQTAVPFSSNTNLLITSLGVTVAFALIFSIAPGLYIARRFGARWISFAWGALVGVVSQVLAGVVGQPLLNALFGSDSSKPDSGSYILSSLLSALLLAVITAAAFYAAYIFALRWDYERTWANAMMFGAGSLALLSGLGLAFSQVPYLSFLLSPPTSEQLSTATAEQYQGYITTVESFSKASGFEPLLSLLYVLLQGVMIFGVAVLVMQTAKGGGYQWAGIAVALFTAFSGLGVVIERLVQPALGLVPTTILNFLLLAAIAAVALYFVRLFYRVDQIERKLEAEEAAATEKKTAEPVEQIMTDIPEEPRPRNRKRR